MAEEATKTPLDDLKGGLQEAKDQREIAESDLSKAKQDLVEVRREYPEKIATAKNTLWHAREALREKRKERKHLAGRRRTLHRQRHRNEAARAKLDARIEKKQYAAAKMEARIREDKERLERLPREGRVRLMLCRLLKVKIAYLEQRSARTRQTTKRLKEGTGQLDGSRSRNEDKLKDVENLLENRKQEEQGAIKDVAEKRKELDVLTNAWRGKEAQGEQRIHHAWETALKKRRAVWIAASRVSSEALKFPWQRVAVWIVPFGKWAGFAGVSGCFYVYAVWLGAAYQFSYFRSNGVDIFSYAEPIDFLAPGYSLAAFFILTTGLVALIPLALYHLVKLIVILPLPLYAEILAPVSSFFAKRIPKTSLFVLSCTIWLLCSLLVAAGVGSSRKDTSPISQDCVSIVTDPPFQYQPEYVRIGSTSKYLFLREEAGGCPVSSTDKAIAQNNDDRDWNLIDTIGSVWTGLKESLWAGDEGKPDPILVVPLSKITCISETTGNGEGLCRPAAVKSPPPAEDPVDQHIANDMGCCPGKLDKSIFFSFVHDKGSVMDESPEQTPRLKKDWKPEVQEFVQRKNGKAAKWRVYGFASLDGLSADNDKLSLERAETVRDMLCTASKTWSSMKECQKEVEIRYLGENHLVTAGPKSQSAVIAVCERVPQQNPEKTTTPAREPVPSSG